MTNADLQQILRTVYFNEWKKRNRIHDKLGEALHAVAEFRNQLLTSQAWLERIGAEWKVSGYEKADDYLARVWPLAPLEEQVLDPCRSRAENE